MNTKLQLQNIGKNKSVLSIGIVIGCLILGGFYYASQKSNQKPMPPAATTQTTQRTLQASTPSSTHNDNTPPIDYFLSYCENDYNEKIKILDGYTNKLNNGDTTLSIEDIKRLGQRLGIYDENYFVVDEQLYVKNCVTTEQAKWNSQ